MRLPPPPEPPRAAPRTPFPVVAVAAPMVGAVIIGLIIGSPFMLMFAALGPIIAVASVLDGRRNGRRHRRAERERFDRECQLFELEIDRAHRAERASADTVHPIVEFGDRDERERSPLRVGTAPGPSAITSDIAPSIADSADEDRRRRMLARSALNPQLPALIARGPLVLIGDGLVADSLARRWSREPGVSLERRSAGEGQVVDTAAHAAIITVHSATHLDVRLPGASPRRVRPEFSSVREVLAMTQGVDAEADLPVELSWSELEAMPRENADGQGVLIGRAATGAAVIDLVAAGPHAIVGGTTGSGKSEFLRCLALGWAAGAPPDRAQLLFVDFKGGATFAGLTDLPHSVGLVTDLDPIIAQRAVRALRAELRYREHTLAEAAVRDVRDRPELLPRLLVLVDEFAALIETFPDVHAVFSDLAARGRSLGVHLVLCTQHPSGIVRDAISTNCPVRVSFRVTDPAAASFVGDLSRDLVAAPPGRAAVVDERGSRAVQVAVIDDDDIARILERWQHHPAAASSWCPPLPDVVTALEVDELVEHESDGAGAGARASTSMRLDAIDFGLVDDPDNRCRRVARWTPSRDGSLAVLGSSHSGRTTLLATLAQQAEHRADIVVLPKELPAAWATLERLAHACTRSTLLLADDLDETLARAGDRAVELLTKWDAAVRSVRAAGGAVAGVISTSAPAATTVLTRFESRVQLRCADADEHAVVGAPRGLFDRRAPAGRGWWRELQLHTILPTTALPEPADGSAPLWRPPTSGDLVVVTTRVADVAARVAERCTGHRVVRDVRTLDAQPLGPVGSVALDPRIVIATPDTWQSAWGALSIARHVAPVVLTQVDAADVRTLLAFRDALAPLDIAAGECWVAEPGSPPLRARWSALSNS